MFCPSCGTKNNYYHRFCFHCGANLSTPAEAEKTEVQKLELQDNDSHESEPAQIVQYPVQESKLANRMQKESTLQQRQQETASLVDVKNNEFSNDSYITDLHDDESDEEEFDLRRQMPLRRYQKDVGHDGLQTLIKVCISVVLIALIAFLCYIGYDQLFKDPDTTEPVVKHIDLEYSVEESTTEDGSTARKVIVLTDNGEQVNLFGKTVPVIGGRAEIVLPDSEFNIHDYENENGFLQVSLELVVRADGYPDRKEEISFEVPVHTAPLTIISPSGKEAVVDGNSYQLILEVQPGSEVFIDSNNYSHLLNEQGQLSVQLEVPDQSETRYEIRVSTQGFEDAIDEIILRKRQMEFPLEVKGSVPILAAEEEWVEINGNTHPEAVLTSNLEMREQPVVDPISGDFKLYVKAKAKGYTPFILTASVEGKLDSVLELVIERPTTEQEYTSTAWAADYEQLKNYPNLHNGFHFAFKGTVKEISSTGTKTTLLVNIAGEGQPEQIICVDYWGQSTFTIGQRIRIFGNRWGNKDGVPYILAPFVYR